MSWLDVGWHFDLVALALVIAPIGLLIALGFWRDRDREQRLGREDERELREWVEALEEQAFRRDLRQGF